MKIIKFPVTDLCDLWSPLKLCHFISEHINDAHKQKGDVTATVDEFSALVVITFHRMDANDIDVVREGIYIGQLVFGIPWMDRR